jgi:hypothetical protein
MPGFFDHIAAPRTNRDALMEVVGGVRRRWRLRVALRGLAILAATALVAFVVASLFLDRVRLSPEAIAALRWVAYGVVALVAVRVLVLPLRRRVSDEQVALYLEERETSLHGHVVSAVEFGHAADDPDASPELSARVIERAVARCAAIENGRRIEAPAIRRSSGWLAGTAAMGAILVALSPGFVRQGAPFLLTPWLVDALANPYAIEVAPGDASIARGADLEVAAQTVNFTGDAVLQLQREAGGEWERWPMVPAESPGTFDFVVFALEDDASYYVEASGVRSPVFAVTVRDLPYVAAMTHEYHFPRYTGLRSRVVEEAGDIATLAGTRVAVTVTTTVPVSGGAIVVDERDTIPLLPLTGTEASADLPVREPGHYRVVLHALDGTVVTGSPDYLIEVLADQPPLVRFRTPGRDLQVTTIDEVFAEVEAEDDYGVASVELVYRVNGGEEDTIALVTDGRRREFAGGHTFFLEEWPLDPGDIVSYFARARDANAVGGSQSASTDIYFLQIRPFDRRFRQAAAQGQPGQQGGTASVGELSARQRQIVAGTFNLVRDSSSYAAREVTEHVATLTLAQGRLREEVATLLDRMQSRGVVQLDSTLQTVMDELPQALEAMEQAERALGTGQVSDALPPEERALQHLQRAEAAYREREVTQGGGGGGGGGGQSAEAEELADLFDMEMDRLRNQYESVDRGRQQEGSEALDEAMERLRELARRQQQENERLRAQASSQGGGGSGRSQRQLADETEELARELQRLAREQSRPELEETARELQEAADAMRRAAAQARSGGEGQGSSALSGLRDAQRRLEQSQTADFRRRVEDAVRDAEALVQEQRDVEDEVRRLGASGQDRDALERLQETKRQMADDVRQLEGDIERLGREGAADQPEAARELRETARGIRDGRVADKILYSQGVIQSGSDEYANSFEESITDDVEGVRERLEAALGSVGEPPGQRVAQALERLRDVVGGLESMQDRAAQDPSGDEAQQQGQERGQGRAGQEGEGGQQGQEGQEGERAAQAPRAPGGGNASPDGRARQFSRELSARGQELRELERELRAEGVDVDGFAEILRRLERVERDGLGTPQGMAQLRDAVIPGLKELEFRLRRDVLREDGEVVAAGSDEVPARYRRLVEAYFRDLSRRRP